MDRHRSSLGEGRKGGREGGVRYIPRPNAKAPTKHIRYVINRSGGSLCLSDEKGPTGVVVALACRSVIFPPAARTRSPKLADSAMQGKISASLRSVSVDRLGRIAARNVFHDTVCPIFYGPSPSARPRIQSAMATVREEAIKTVSESRTTLLTSRVYTGDT